MTPLESAWEILPGFRKNSLPKNYPNNLHHLFAPIDRVHEAFVSLCKASNTSLAAAMYGWDDDEINDLFYTKLTTEHMPVYLSLDKTQAAGKHEKELLTKWNNDLVGNSIAIGRSSRGAISHDKMIVIDGLVTICGSTNLSEGGESKQNNEAVIVWDPIFAIEARARIDVIHDEMLKQQARTQ